MKPMNRIGMFIVALTALLLPHRALASDTTGAAVYFLGIALIIGLVVCLGIGLGLALLLKYVGKRGNWVWWLIPAVPLIAVAVLLVSLFLPGNIGNPDRRYHSGPDLEFNGSHSVTVSPEFGQKELDRALATINSPQFTTELANYTDVPLSNYAFALNLTAPYKREARHYVSICVQPEVHVNTSIYEGIMFLFSKAVIEADPHPCDSGYSEPTKLR